MKARKFTAMLLTLAMVLGLCGISAMAAYPTGTGAGLTFQFGDPNYAEESPEKDMVLAGTAPTYTVNYCGPLNDYGTSQEIYYPYILALYVTQGGGNISEITAAGLTYELYNADIDGYAPIEDVGSIPSNIGTLGITVELSQESSVTTRRLAITTSSGTLTLNFNQPVSYSADTENTTPAALNGYLPIGQYSNGKMWGSPYTTGTTAKLVGGYSSTGVSLGAAGGYVEYAFNLNDSANRPYGIDFIVYGNAFVNNPEAASVKVYGTTSGGETGWYELAGSLYYADETVRNVDVTYRKVTADTVDSDCDTAGIWYKIERDGQTLRNWTKFNTNTTVTWWPESSEGYLGNPIPTGGNELVSVNADQTEITYKNVTLIRDTDTTPDYAFGYADITPNGTNYGTVTANPYTYNTTGGNGFDLDWAVDDNGRPVDLTSISKVRVYTSAALKVSGTGDLSEPDAPLFTTPSIFGETSAEVCGIYAVTGTGTGAETSVANAALSITGVTSPALAPTITTANTYEVAADEDITVSFGNVAGANVFVNGVSGTGGASLTFTLEEEAEQIIRVIVKDDTTGLPYIGYCKLVGVR